MTKDLHRNKSILVVEDSESAAAFLLTFLKAEGFSVVHAAGGARALDLLHQQDFSLVLLDLMMPRIDGFDVLERMRAEDSLKAIPVIVLTARSSVEDRVKALRVGANDYMVKPFEAPELMARINAFLREQDLREELTERVEELACALDSQKELACELEKKNEELERLSHLKDHFISIASHDLRSPLTNIKGYADLLIHEALGPIDDEQRSALQVVLRNCSHLLDILSKLLDVSRIDSGEFSLNPAEHDMGEIIARSVTSYIPQAQAKKISLETHIARDLPLVRCDHERIVSLMENLISNAIKFSNKEDTVVVSGSVEGEMFQLEVKDTGPGIPQPELPLLFQRFSRLSVRPTGGEKTVGLGLSLVRDIARMHEGSVKAISNVGVGTTFIVKLPVNGPTVSTDDEG